MLVLFSPFRPFRPFFLFEADSLIETFNDHDHDHGHRHEYVVR